MMPSDWSRKKKEEQRGMYFENLRRSQQAPKGTIVTRPNGSQVCLDTWGDTNKNHKLGAIMAHVMAGGKLAGEK